MNDETASAGDEAPQDFVRDIVRRDLAEGRVETVVTRFPPEPNGYLHIGHAKSICLNFGIAEAFGGRCHLRFDDTNPSKEEQEYIDAIEEDVRWLGFDWGRHLHHASDYFEQLYLCAVHLIHEGKAYVDDLTAEEIRDHRGTLTAPGRPSPYRDRPVEENLELFRRMRAGKFPDGTRTLRAKIDMAAGNINLRDPVLYRIQHKTHPLTGETWSIYPTYDFAHGQSDAIEGVTHSICTLEFEDHRPLYDWLIENLSGPLICFTHYNEPPSDERAGGQVSLSWSDIDYEILKKLMAVTALSSKVWSERRPRQYEFARLNLTHTVLSKRRLIELVREGHVAGWDDPRMPTISGLRRRGVPPEAIREFCRRIGVTKSAATIDVAFLDHCMREYLNKAAERRMAVLDPLKLVIENYPEGETAELEAVNNPEDASAGSRTVPFSRELWIERDDFMEDPPKKFFRLGPGREVRLRYAYFVTCTDVVKDEAGKVVELRCTYDPETRGGDAPDGRKVKGTLHWVSAAHAVDAEVRDYQHLFMSADPGAEDDPIADLNPDSLEIRTGCKLEPSLAGWPLGKALQFERLGYYAADKDSTPDRPVFNRTVGLRDTWAKIAKQG